jgi:hypothetical protein
MAQDASRTDAQRTRSKFQEMLWLKMANEAEENDDARRVMLGLRSAN